MSLSLLDEIAGRVAQRPGALGLLALGSAGARTDRRDEQSDLDFFVITQDKPAMLADVWWLSEVQWSHRNTPDGYRALVGDVLCEFAVFTPEETDDVRGTAGRWVWRAEDCPEIALRAPEPASAQWFVDEILSDLYVGLHLWLRGERLAAIRSYRLRRSPASCGCRPCVMPPRTWTPSIPRVAPRGGTFRWIDWPRDTRVPRRRPRSWSPCSIRPSVPCAMRWCRCCNGPCEGTTRGADSGARTGTRRCSGAASAPVQDPQHRLVLTQQTHAARSYEQAEHDEHHPEDHFAAHDREDAADHQGDGQQPEEEVHIVIYPVCNG